MQKYAENILRDLLKIKDIDAITFQVREESFYYGSRKKLILSDDFYINQLIVYQHKMKIFPHIQYENYFQELADNNYPNTRNIMPRVRTEQCKKKDKISGSMHIE